ncbi:type 1 glutamine amidotransferase [Rhizobium glycinendophyticum]|uniref:Type 1 glutamine amidotransferase n=1 Tax=Rhizobium glycinendophyticum TaxID=2589807 RepID=A0A504U954_9HYPH|nr:type 1 glutamine amidotransferase [Rhizobium glycinendophyticum]TPP07175.1 type 1 glutamine amidotransferase [Rhizobium glycinendophyticum]
MTKKTIGILVTGHSPAELEETYGNYADMFTRLLGGFDFQFKRYFVVDGEFPSSPEDADGWLLTGSKFGVYEEHDWIRRLEQFIRDVHAAKVPMVGICFGHQVMAKALGGHVEKFKGGWSAGPVTYRRSDTGEEQVLLAWHQDQVLTVPDGAEVVGKTEACENAVIRYGDWGLSYQPHPEFTPSFFEGLAEARKAAIPQSLFERVKKVDAPIATDRIAREIGEFFERPR